MSDLSTLILIERIETILAQLSGPKPEIDLARTELTALRGELRHMVHQSFPILLMDDDDDLAEFLGEALTDFGFQVDRVNNGEKALRMSADRRHTKQPYSIAILDVIVSGGMGGVDILPNLLKDNPDLRVIFSSGNPSEIALLPANPDAVVRCLTKPYSIAQMHKAIQSALVQIVPFPIEPQ